MAGTPFTLAEYAALTISDCLTKGYYVVPNAYDLPQLRWGNPTDCYINALRQWNLPFEEWTVFLAHHPYIKFYSKRALRLDQPPGWLQGSPNRANRASKSYTEQSIWSFTSLSGSFACIAKRP